MIVLHESKIFYHTMFFYLKLYIYHRGYIFVWHKVLFCPLRAISSIPVATLNDGRIYTRDELLHIRQADYSSKYKSEEEFCSIIRLDILCWLHDRCFGVEEPNCGNKETSPSLRQKTVCVPSRYNKETNNPSKTNYPSVCTSWRHANRRIRRILLHNSSWHRIYTRDELSVWDG